MCVCGYVWALLYVFIVLTTWTVSFYSNHLCTKNKFAIETANGESPGAQIRSDWTSKQNLSEINSKHWNVGGTGKSLHPAQDYFWTVTSAMLNFYHIWVAFFWKIASKYLSNILCSCKMTLPHLTVKNQCSTLRGMPGFPFSGNYYSGARAVDFLLCFLLCFLALYLFLVID